MQADRQTDRQTDMLVAILHPPSGSEVLIGLLHELPSYLSQYATAPYLGNTWLISTRFLQQKKQLDMWSQRQTVRMTIKEPRLLCNDARQFHQTQCQ